MAGNANTTYVAKKASSLANPTALTTFVTADNAAVAAAIYFPTIVPAASLLSARFNVKAWGRCTAGTSGNMDATLYFGNSVTAASNTALGALGVQTNAAKAHWFIDATLIWDGNSQVLDGLFSGGSGSTLALKANTLVTPKTAVDLTVTGNALTIGGIFGTGNAANVYFMDGFTMEVL